MIGKLLSIQTNQLNTMEKFQEKQRLVVHVTKTRTGRGYFSQIAIIPLQT